MTTLFDRVTETLRKIYDKRSNNDIVSLGIIDGLHVDETGQVKISLKVPLGEEESFKILEQRIQDAVSALDEVTAVRIFCMRDKQTVAAPVRFELPRVRHVILVGSGKGGVGKSTVAVNLSCAMVRQGYKVGLLDADIYGPSVPFMLSSQGSPSLDEEKKIIPYETYGVKHLSIAHLLPDESAVIWRGPMLQKALMQMLVETQWGDLDYLFIDLPPGTGDVQISLVQKLNVTGAILVTTPQDLALLDVRKAHEMFQKTATPILGLVENMSTFICPHCHQASEIFHTGGGAAFAQEMHMPLLGSIPLDMAIRMGADQGQPIAQENHPIADIYGQMARALSARLEQRQVHQTQ